VFFIRHGESNWNKAQHDKNIGLAFGFDHGLSETGRLQAVGLNERLAALLKTRSFDEADKGSFGEGSRKTSEGSGKGPGKGGSMTREYRDHLYNEFLRAPGPMIVSPLTRAIQTCMFGVQSHPALTDKGVRLVTEAREVKNLIGVDTIGIAKGPEIKARLLSETAELLKEIPDDDTCTFMESVPFDYNDACDEWWSTRKETADDVTRRMHELIEYIKHMTGDSVIIIGHSLMFRKLVSTFLADAFKQAHPELSEILCTQKLPNAGVLGTKMNFAQDDHDGCILEAWPLFGTNFGNAEGARGGGGE
jgi:broad specificity phosphatase PhoE